MSDLLEILGRKIERGGSAIIEVDIARLPTRSRIEIPVILERGKEDGPTLLMLAGIHGDETNGIEIVRQIVANGWNKPQRGTTICIPVLNVFGFIHQTRELPDGRDLNRVFPGTKTGTLASQFAYKLMTEVVPHVDICMDFHTGASNRFNFSQIRISNGDSELLELAKVFGAPFILKADHRDKSFRESVSRLGKKVMLFEGGKSLDLNRSVTKSGLAGALRVMQQLGMRSFTRQLKEYPEYHSPVILEGSSWIRAQFAGMFRASIKAGSLVRKGQVLGTITDPFGQFEVKVKASRSGYIICTNHAPIVNMGDAIFNVGY